MIFKEIDLSKLKDNNVLFFTRIHGKKGIFGEYYPHSFLNEFKGLKKFRTISEYPVADVYINININNLSNISNDDFSLFEELLDIEDIIIRCRALRSISHEESKQLIWVVAKFFLDYFSDNTSLKVIVALIVDNYVMDVMERFCNHFNIKIIHVIGFFAPGYVRLTDRFGVGIPTRLVPKSEVDLLYNKLISKQKSHMAISKKVALKNAVRDYISYRYRYLFRYLMGYKLNGNLSYEYRFSKVFQGFNTLLKYNISKFYDDISDIKDSPSKLIFIPLHFHPEATVDYWSDKKEHADYINSLLKTIALCKSLGLKIVFKEHPKYYLRRSTEFYTKIKSSNNSYLIDPYIASQDLLEMVDNVCVYTGSVGLEALMIDKRVYTVSENYYSFNRLPNLLEYKKEQYPFFSLEEKKDLLKKILQTTFRI